MVIIVGSNTTEAHPLLAYRIKRSQKNGQKVFVFDLLKNEMGREQVNFTHQRVVQISAVTKYIIDQGWENDTFIDEWINGFDAYKESLSKFTIDYAKNNRNFRRKFNRNSERDLQW